MQPIGKAISGLKWKAPRGIPSFEEIAESIYGHPIVKELLVAHPEISRDVLDRSIAKLDQAIADLHHCNQCTSLHTCSNLVKGHQAKLNWTGSYLETVYTACPKWIGRKEQLQREALIKSHYIPRDVLSATFQNFEQDPKRFDAFKALLEFCLRVEPGSKDRKMKGIYLYGPLGVGKSHLMAATARKLADRGISSLMVYTPDFFREIKDSLQDHSLQDKVSTLKNVPVLILDDIGAENLSPWARDEILGALLQYRISENLPTLYTSNYNYKLLEEHLSYSAKGGIESLKAKRIMERIVHYTDLYLVDGNNRREGQL
ncbi:MAG TPA: primosomal protein DnaI [Bacillota bacterium]|nr:primosomal protein DnaI [Bacillota bacterium]